MKCDAEKIVIAVGLIFLALASIETFATSGQTLAKEEAIEISRNSPLVQQSFEDSDRYSIEVHYVNASTPESHGIWDITWYIHMRGYPSAAEIMVSQSIDDKTGKILNEGSLMLR
jgi:hypothetical protein